MVYACKSNSEDKVMGKVNQSKNLFVWGHVLFQRGSQRKL